MQLASAVLTYRTIDPDRDGELAAAHHREACLTSFGRRARPQPAANYVRWLRAKVEEFPEGYLLAYLDDRCVGQMELEAPYGKEAGYVNLFYVTPPFRGLGFGRLLHERAVQYFRSWEARRVELHVSPSNIAALRFYRRMGYHRSFAADDGALWTMLLSLPDRMGAG